jgi:magnesium transporter
LRFRLRKPRELAHALVAAARRDRDEVADYLELRPEEWEALVDASPSDAADVIEQLRDVDAADLISDLEPGDAALVLEEIAPELAAEIAEHVPLAELTAALASMTDHEAADLLAELDDGLVEDVLDRIDDRTEAAYRRLMQYPADTAGGLMSTEIAFLPLGLTTGEAIERIRQLNEQYEDLAYIYVVDEEKRLHGVVSFRHLVFKRPGATLADVMIPGPITVEPLTDREEIAAICQRYHLLGVPVVDADGRLLGMVPNEAVIEAIQDEASEDFAAAVGAGIGETVYSDVGASFLVRAPWLLLNLVLALFVALIIEQQTGVISREPVLAALMPVIALIGGNGGNQSLAVMIRSMASDDVPGSQVPGILARQTGVGVLNGLVLAVIGGSLTYLLLLSKVFETRTNGLAVALTVGLASIVNLSVGTLAGAAIPVALRKLGQDPALASAIFLTLLTDAVGFGGFLLIADAFL